MAVLSVGGRIQTFVRDRLCWNPRVSFLLKPLSCHSIDQSLWGEGGGKKKNFYRDLGSKMWKGGMFMRKERNTCLWMRITYTEKSDKVTSPLKTNLGNRLPQNSGSPNPFSTFKGWLCNSQNSSDENVLVVKYWRFGFGYFLSTLCVIQDIQLIIMKTWLKT